MGNIGLFLTKKLYIEEKLKIAAPVFPIFWIITRIVVQEITKKNYDEITHTWRINNVRLC